MFTRRTLALAAGIAATAIIAAGCSSATPSAGGSTASGGTLTLAVLAAPTSMDPVQLDSNGDTVLWNSIYDTLLRDDPNGDIVPEAASSYSYNATHTELTLKLRSGMKFSNGDAVTAQDVAAGLKRLMAAKNAEVSPVASVGAPDPLTVQIKLSQPDPVLLEDLSHATGVISDPATAASAGSATAPIGSGPYTLDAAATVTGSTYTLEKNPAFWDAKSYPFKNVVVKVITDNTAAANALRSGQIDSTVILPNQASGLKGAGFTIQAQPGNAWAGLYLADRAGTKIPALGSLRVRQAINMAFDRSAIVSGLLEGYGNPVEQIFGPKTAGYVPALNSTYPYDVAKAKQLMAQAGYAQGFSLTMPDFPYLEPLEPTITQELGAIGIKVTWQSVPENELGPRVIGGDYPAFFFLNGLDSDANDMINQISPIGELNPYKSAASQLTGLIEQAVGAPSEQAAVPLYQQINSYVVQQAWFAPIFDLSLLTATDHKVTWNAPGANGWSTVRNYAPAQ